MYKVSFSSYPKVCIIAFILCFVSTLHAQSLLGDSTIHPKFTFDWSAIHLYEWEGGGKPVYNRDPGYEWYSVHPYGYTESFSHNYVTDNPLNHGAQAVDLFASLSLIPGLHGDLDLIAEHRGASYGVYSTRAIFVYPRASITFDTAVMLFGERFPVNILVGNLSNIREFQGLLMYNIDGQGSFMSVGWNHLALKWYHIGDLVNGIGLNIDDGFNQSLELNDVPVTDRWKMDAAIGNFFYSTVNPRFLNLPTSDDDFFTIHPLYIGTTMSNFGWNSSLVFRLDSLSLYGEGAIRPILKGPGSYKGQSAFLVGAKDDWQTSNFELHARAEYRYYGGQFLDDYLNEDVHYRSGSYDGTIGRFLYPLSYFERPYSQLAVFSQFQGGRDVSGVTLQLESKYRFYQAFEFLANADLNLISVANAEHLWRPFYEVGFMWEPIRNTGIMMTATNRAMDLDESYPTLFELKRPVIKMEVRYNFGKAKY